ncbi:MAG: PilN domain-containing protein [Candidatus Saelkia tenebricola]|nr:PilN domain-containing protein [Candidatus Saelkia tenebricola]
MLVLEIDDLFIKIAQGEFKGGIIKLEKGAIFRRDDLDLNIFKNIFKSSIQKKENIICAIPRGKISISYYTFPTKDPKEITEMTKFNALKQLPDSKGDIVFSHSILNVNAQGQSKVMLAVGRKNLIKERYLQLLKDVKIEPYVTINSIPLANIFTAKGLGKECFLVIDVDSKATNICVVDKEKLIFSREVDKGAGKFIGNEVVLELWLIEIERSVAAYQKENLGSDIKKCYISGVELPDSVRKILSEKLSLEVEYIPLNKLVDFSQGEIKSYAESVKLSSVSFTKVAGLLTLQKAPEINLTSLETLQKKVSVQKCRTNLIISSYLFIALFGFIGTIGWEFYYRRAYINDLENTIVSMKKKIDILERKKRIVDLTLDLIRNESSFLNVIKDLGLAIPSDVKLQTLDYKGDRISIGGISSTLDSIYDFSDKLRKSPIIIKVEDLKVRETGGDKRSFTLQASLKVYDKK